MKKTLEERFWTKVARCATDECWLWMGARNRTSYGQVRAHNKTMLAHRVAWELANGPILEGWRVCHRCDNSSCCNPAHLWLGTDADNVADCEAKGRAVHPHGDAHGSRLYPECRPRGATHFSHTHPERLARGEHAGCAKLTAADVVIIRQRAANGEMKIRIAADFGVSDVNVGCIVRRETWKHVA